MTTTDKTLTLVEIDAYDPNRSNLAGYSRALDNAYWSKVGATIGANAAAGTDNLVLADKLTENAANSGHYMEKSITGLTTNQAFTLSAFAKAAGRTTLQMTLYAAAYASLGRVTVDLSTGVCTPAAGGTGTVAAAYAQAYGGGWWRVVLVCQPETANNGTLIPRFLMINGGATYLGDGTSGVLLDRILLEVGSVLGEPIDTTTAGPGIKTLRYSDRPFITAGADVPPHVAFAARLSAAPNMERRILSDLRTMQGADAGGGTLELSNADHGLSSLLDLGLDGREVRVYSGQEGAAFPSGFTQVMTATIEQIEVGNTKAVLRLRDRMEVLAVPLQSTRYAGTNAAGSGQEGDADNIKGQVKPLAFGRVYHAPAVMVNTGKLTYQLHDGQIQAVNAVYDKGAALTFSANHANLAALQAAVVAGGSYATCLALGLIRLGASAAGKVTADFQGDAASSYVDRPGAIIRRILETKAGIATAQIDTAAFTALDAAANYEAGIFFGQETTIQEAVNKVAASVGAYVIPSRTGLWTTAQLLAPSGSAAFQITDDRIIDIDRLTPTDEGKGNPAWRVTVRYKPFWMAFQEADLVAVGASLTEANRAIYLQQWRSTVASDATVKTVHPLSQEIIRDTVLTTAGNADSERTRLLALFSVRRDLIRVRVPFIPTFATIDFGAVIEVVSTAFGYTAGRKFVPLSITREEDDLILDLWG